jgi:hypothetical protein
MGKAFAPEERPEVPPAPRYDHIGAYMVTKESLRQLLQLTSYAFGTYKALGKRASDREGICNRGKTRSAGSPVGIT